MAKSDRRSPSLAEPPGGSRPRLGRILLFQTTDVRQAQGQDVFAGALGQARLLEQRTGTRRLEDATLLVDVQLRTHTSRVEAPPGTARQLEARRDRPAGNDPHAALLEDLPCRLLLRRRRHLRRL